MINRVIATSDVNKDGKVNKFELFTLFKTLINTNFDNNVFGNYTQQNNFGNQGIQPNKNNLNNQYGQYAAELANQKGNSENQYGQYAAQLANQNPQNKLGYEAAQHAHQKGNSANQQSPNQPSNVNPYENKSYK